MDLTAIRANSRWFALGASDDLSFSDADVLRCTNLNYQILVAIAIRHDDAWRLLDGATLTSDIVAATRVIALPTMPLTIKRVEVKYPSASSDYVKAEEVDKDAISNNGYDNYTPSRPEYMLEGTDLILFLPNKTSDIEAVTSGVKIYWEDEVTELAAVSDTTILPEFVNKLLCQLNAKDYCGANSMSERQGWLRNEIGSEEKKTGSMNKFVAHVSRRAEDKQPRIDFVQENYR